MISDVRSYEDISLLLLALRMIALESSEPETVRVALVALYESEHGRAFLAADPIKL